ncbi:MAG: protein kinase [Gemmatimonadaceae bacterium]
MSAKQALLERVKTVASSRFDVRGEIGRGGMAAVFVAQDLRLNRRVALKVMLPGLAFTDGMSERFEQEARTAANLDHPNIVTIFGVEEIDDLLFFVMKYVEGRSLDKVTRDVGPLPIDVTQFILLHVAMALAYAHDERVVHRDVKPGNVLLDRRGTPIVTDFGIAKAAEAPSLTVPGSIVGTPAYMSPEQFMGLPALPSSDQYALGIMAYEMLAGELPFQGTMVELQLKHIQDAPKPVSDIRRDIPASLEGIVMRMLAKHPEERFKSLHEAEAALRALPLDESVARNRLVELGFLTDGAAPYGLPPTPVRTGEKEALKGKSGGRDAMAGATPVAPENEKTVVGSSSKPPTKPSTPRASRVIAPQPSLPSVAYVRITSVPASVTTGEIVPLQGIAYDATNTPIPGKSVAWDISPAGAARIAADGTLTVLAPGALTVSAVCDGKRTLAEIQVTPVPKSVTPPRVVAPPADRGIALPAGGTRPAEVEEPRRERVVVKERESTGTNAKDHAGTPFFTPRVAAITAGIAVVALAGALLVSRLTSSPDAVSATSGAQQEAPPTPNAPPVSPAAPSAPVVVDSALPSTTPSSGTIDDAKSLTPATVRVLGASPEMRVGERVRLRVEATSASGDAITGSKVTWRSSDPSVAQIDAARGNLVALRAGSAHITAKVSGVEGETAVRVAAPNLSSLVIHDLRALSTGESITLHLSAESDAGTLDATSLGTMGVIPRWSSSAPNIVRVDARTGELTALAKGTAAITVDAGGLKQSGTVSVSGPTVVAPAPPVTPTPPVERPAPRPADRRTRSENDVRREVTEALNAYSTAVSARDLGAMQRVFPGMQDTDRKGWQSLFARASEVAYSFDHLDFSEPLDVSDAGRVTVTRHYSLTITANKAKDSGKTDGKDRVTMARSADGWHITQIQ